MNRIKFVTVLIALCLAIPTSAAAATERIVNCSLVGTFTIKNNIVVSSDQCAGDVVIPNSVTTIGWAAFYDAKSLISLTIGNSVTTIGRSAFAGARSLRSLTIGNSVTTIGEGAFARLTSLTSLTIGNSVTTIGPGAFAGATSLTSLTIGNSVTTIGRSAFADATSLTSLTVDSANPKFSSDIQGVLYDKEKKVLIQAPLAKSTIIIPDTVVMILENAFEGAKSLSTLIIPNTVKLPEARLIADAKAAADAKAIAKKLIRITCIKGKLVKKITAVKPKCPSGYKKK